jgi:16S rRNA processing protein RimM
MSKIEVGKIVKAQGIKGEVKVLSLTDDTLRFKNFKSLYISDSQKLEIETIRLDGLVVFIKFAEILDRNGAEALVGKHLMIERNEATPLPEGRYYISDLIGSAVLVDGKQIGKLTDILQHGAADVYVLDKGKIMFPALKTLLKNVDISAKKIELDAKVFDEVAVYEV